jgi:Domain of unknown function (DUF1918)
MRRNGAPTIISSVPVSASILRARAGDRLLVRAHHSGEAEHDGEILEVLGENGAPPFVVRWEDEGHVSRLYPGTDAYVQSFEHPT